MIPFLAGFIAGGLVNILIWKVWIIPQIDVIRNRIKINIPQGVLKKQKKLEGAFIRPMSEKSRVTMTYINNNDKKGKETPLSDIL